MSLGGLFQQYEDGTDLFEKMAFEERNRQISPSKWNIRMPQNIYCQTHEKLMIERGDVFLMKGYQFDEVRYGEGEREMYDIFTPNEVTDDTPIVVFFHGGYWQDLARDVFYAPCEPILKQGGICVCVGYDLTPYVSMSIIMEEACKAIEHLLKVTFKNSRNIYLFGQCAGVVNALWGCCYALLSATKIQAIKGFILLSGVYDMKPVSLTSENNKMCINKGEVTRLSLITPENIDRVVKRFKHSKFMLTICQFDTEEFFRQNNFYKEMLEIRGMAVESVLFEGLDHIQPIEMMCQPDSICTQKFLEFIGLDGKK